MGEEKAGPLMRVESRFEKADIRSRYKIKELRYKIDNRAAEPYSYLTCKRKTFKPLNVLWNTKPNY